MALDPMLIPLVTAPDASKVLPTLRAVPSSPLPFCVLHFLFCFGPIVRFLLIVTFASRLFRLTLLYLATKGRPLGEVTRLGVVLRLSKILCL